MNIRAKFFFLLLSFPFLTLFSEQRIDFLEICAETNCKPRTWFVREGFSPELIKKNYRPNSDWKKANEFPLFPWSFYKSDLDLQDYTLLVEFDIPEDLFNSLRHKGFAIGGIGEVFEIYLNGIEIVKAGKVENGEIILHRALRGQVYEVNQSYLQLNNNRLVIHLWGRPGSNNTGLYFTKGNEFGLYEDLRKERQERATLVLIGIYLIIGIYHLFLFLNRRKEAYNFYFGLYSICIGIYILTRTNAIFELNLDTILIRKLEYSILYIDFFSIFSFTEYLFFYRISNKVKYFMYYNLTLAIVTIFTPEFIFKRVLFLWQVTAFFIGIPLIISLMYRGVKANIPSAKRMLLGTIFLSVAALYDLFDARFFGTGISMVKYGFCFYILGIAGILAKNFNEVHDKIEQLNENLEKRVTDRTKELSESFQEIKKLKLQQDGDYYLTSLLIEPLALNKAKQDTIKIEFLIKQKKEFEFRGKRSELGGDICKTESIVLGNRRMSAFLNADAMGKSMQGASGILVLGAVFKSIIERTTFSDSVRQISPERWLKNSFVELHKIFESFEGTMLVSIVIGLIDEKTGLMYFINAEHPRTILFRDQKAAFIGDTNLYQKLGSQLTDGFIRVQTFKMQTGDVILNGSDGRDDILLRRNDEEPKMNSDENFVLGIVEAADGDLPEILNRIEAKGILVDDFSMLSLEWCGEVNKDLLLEKELAIDFLCNEDDGQAYIHLSRYLDFYPDDTVMMQVKAECLNRLGRFEESIEYSERVRIREPKNISNLISLIESYHKISRFDRIEALINSVLRLDPRNIEISRFS